MNKKLKVIIIEDNFDDFTNIKSQLQDDYLCYPKFNEEEFRIFRANLELCFDGGTDELIAKKYIKNVIGAIKKPALFIIDYQLKDDDHKLKISGDKFYNEFIKITQTPSLFITRLDAEKVERDLGGEINHLLRFTRNTTNGFKGLLFKPADLSSVTFKNELKSEIKTLLSKAQIQIDEL